MIKLFLWKYSNIISYLYSTIVSCFSFFIVSNTSFYIRSYNKWICEWICDEFVIKVVPVEKVISSSSSKSFMLNYLWCLTNLLSMFSLTCLAFQSQFFFKKSNHYPALCIIPLFFLLSQLKGALMQIWKQPYMFMFI